jgi:hypothetical protein
MDWSFEMRSGSDSITRSREMPPMSTHPPISGSVRPQPRHHPVEASIAQTLIHGVFIGWSVINIQRNSWSRMGKYAMLQGNKSLSCNGRFL